MMQTQFISRVASLVALVASSLFVGDLFLDWQRASVDIAGVIQTESSSMGWGGWASAAGLFAVLIVIVALRDLGGHETTANHVLAVAVLPIGLLVATALAVFTGDANVDVANAVSVQVETTLWAAWAGLAFAVVAFVATLVPVLLHLGRPAPRGLPGPA
jgi:hypothetical protein